MPHIKHWKTCLFFFKLSAVKVKEKLKNEFLDFVDLALLLGTFSDCSLPSAPKTEECKWQESPCTQKRSTTSSSKLDKKSTQNLYFRTIENQKRPFLSLCRAAKQTDQKLRCSEATCCSCETNAHEKQHRIEETAERLSENLGHC